MNETSLTKEQNEKILAISRDFYRYAKNNLWIKDKDAAIVKFEPNLAQKLLISRVLHLLETGQPIRIIILKARQMGLSTAVEALIYWWTSTHSNITASIVGHEEASSKNLYNMFKRYYDNCNPLFKPSRKYDTRTDLVFAREDEAGNQVGLNSVIKTATAKNVSAGRSDTIQLLHGCLHKDSLVVLADGSSKKIKDINLGDLVYTSSGAIAPVSAKTMTGVKQTYKINSWMSNEPIIASADHKILTENGYIKLSELTPTSWVAKPKYKFEYRTELECEVPQGVRPQGGGSRRETKRTFMLNYDFGYLVGYYLAEGHISKNLHRTVFTYEKSERFVDAVKHWFQREPRETVSEGRGRSEFNDAFMTGVLNQICGRVDSKHVPLFGNTEFFSGIMSGYTDGDGSKTDLQRVRATSVHERIARNINRIGDMLGYHGSLQFSHRSRYGVKTKDVWTNSFCNGKGSKYKFIDGQCFVRVKSIEPFEVEETYDIEIDHPDHNFETPGGVVSNSEVATWPDGEALVASLLQTVPVRKNTMIFLESTAEGRGNFFYKQWQASVNGETVFEPFFFPWWIQDEYEMEGTIDKYTEEEEEIVKMMRDGYKIGNEVYVIDEDHIPKKILFRRYKEKEFAATPERLYQEYPSTPHEAFIASGSTVFNIQALSLMEKHCLPIKEVKHYNLVDSKERKVTAVEVTDSNKQFTPLKIFEMPIPHEEYVIGADVADLGNDFCVADVIKKSTMETVAKYRSDNVDPDQFGVLLEQLGRFYNYALIGCEVNNHGLTTIQRLRNLFYRNIYRREKGRDEIFEETTSRFGWRTDIMTKPLMIDYLAEAIREGMVKDPDIVFVEEAFSYIKDHRGKTHADEGAHDDTIMAKAIALQMWDWATNNKSNLKVHKPKAIRKKR